MNLDPATITAILTGVAGVVTAVTALVHTMRTRSQVEHVSAVVGIHNMTPDAHAANPDRPR